MYSFLTPIYYLPKFRRNLQVCSFDGLSVCLFVCLERDTGRTVRQIHTKLGPHMESGTSHRCIVFIGQSLYNIQCPPAKRSCLVKQASWRKKIERDGAPSHWIIIFFISPERGYNFDQNRQLCYDLCLEICISPTLWITTDLETHQITSNRSEYIQFEMHVSVGYDRCC